MARARQLIQSRGGLAPTHRLLAAGVSPAVLAWSVRAGTIVRVRKGWYCLPDLPIELQRAARIGGRLTGPSAARSAGCWAPPDVRLHVAVPPNACRLRDRDDLRRRLSASVGGSVVVHWTDDRRGSSPLVRSVPGWLRDCVTTLPPAFAVAVADSAIHTGLVSWFQWQELRASLPCATAQLLSIVDGIPDSGTESIARHLLWQAGIHSRSRAVVSDGMEVDLLVGDRLVIEVDSETFHGKRKQRLSDLERDARLAAAGYIVLRFDYVHVMSRPDLILEAVRRHVALGDHLATSRR